MNTNQDKLNFESTGDGRKLAVYSHKNNNNSLLFFIHGAGGRSAQWSHQIEHFKKDHETFLFDLLGHGKSQRPRQGFSFKDISNDVDVLYKKYRSKQNIVIAHSYGVALAIDLVLKNNNIQKLVLIGAGTPTAIEKIGPWNLPPFILEWIRPMFSNYFADKAFHSGTDPDLVHSERSISDQNSMFMMKELIKGMKDIPIMDLNKIHIPVLIIQGESDGLTPLSGAKELNELLVNSELLIVKNASHLVMIEKPDEINNLISEFIKER